MSSLIANQSKKKICVLVLIKLSFIIRTAYMPLYKFTDTITIITTTACHNYMQPQLFCSHKACINSVLPELLLHESILFLFSPFIVQHI